MTVSWWFGLVLLALCRATPTHRGSKQLFRESEDALDPVHGSGDGSGLGPLPDDQNEEPTIDRVAAPTNASDIAHKKVPMIEEVENGSGWHEVAIKEEKYVYLVSIEYNADGTVKKFENISVPLSQLNQRKNQPFSVKLQSGDSSFVVPTKTFLQTKGDINPIVPVKATVITAETILAMVPVDEKTSAAPAGTSSPPVQEETSSASPTSLAADQSVASTQPSVDVNQVVVPSNESAIQNTIQNTSNTIQNASNTALPLVGENEIKPSNSSIEAVSATPISVTTEAVASSTGATGADSTSTNPSTAAPSSAISGATTVSPAPQIETTQAESVGATNNASTEGGTNNSSAITEASTQSSTESATAVSIEKMETNLDKNDTASNNTKLEEPIAQSSAVEKIIGSSTQPPLIAIEAVQVTSGVITMAESTTEAPKNSSQQSPDEQSVVEAVAETHANESTKLLVKEVSSTLAAAAVSADVNLDKNKVEPTNATNENEEKAKTNNTENAAPSAASESVPDHAENIANKSENALPTAAIVQAENITNTTESSASSATSALVPVQAENIANTTESSVSSATSELVPVQAENMANTTESSGSSATSALVPVQAENTANTTENSASSATSELVPVQAENIANTTENSASSATSALVPVEAANTTENSASSAAPELVPAQAETEGVANKTENAASSVAPESVPVPAENIANTTESSASSAASESVPVQAESIASEQPVATTAASKLSVEDKKKETDANNGKAESVAAAAAEAVAELANNGPLKANDTVVQTLTNVVEERSNSSTSTIVQTLTNVIEERSNSSNFTLIQTLTNVIEERWNSSTSNETTIAAQVIDDASHKSMLKDTVEAQSPSAKPDSFIAGLTSRATSSQVPEQSPIATNEATTESDAVQGFSVEFTTARTINSSELFKPAIISDTADSDARLCNPMPCCMLETDIPDLAWASPVTEQPSQASAVPAGSPFYPDKTLLMVNLGRCFPLSIIDQRGVCTEVAYGGMYPFRCVRGFFRHGLFAGSSVASIHCGACRV